MKDLIVISAIIALLCQCGAKLDNEFLFIIRENEKTGYINSSGEIVIKPRFANGYDFSEGLAAVREDGLFGYINTSGNFVLKPKYDHATNFVNGVAVVFEDGVKKLIDKKGNVLLNGGFKDVSYTYNNLLIISTAGYKDGLFSPATGKFLIDTVYSDINYYPEGIAVVYVKGASGSTNGASLIDLNGNILVPVGKYVSIGGFNSGVAIASSKIPGIDNEIQTIIDLTGKEVGRIDPAKDIFVTGEFKNGLARAIFYKKTLSRDNNDSFYTVKNTHEGFINTKGEVVFNDTTYLSVTDFNCNRSFIRNADGDYTMIDNKFTKLTTAEYKQVFNGFWPNGYAVVQTEKGTGIIDTLGRFILNPGEYNIEEFSFDGNFFFASHNIDGNNKYSLHRLSGAQMTQPIFDSYNVFSPKRGLMRTIMDNQLTYFDTTGKMVWQQKKAAKSSMVIDTDRMVRGYFRAYSSLAPGTESGGWATSSNFPKRITSDKHLAPDSLNLIIDAENADPLSKDFKGYNVYIGNTTKDTVKFDAQDSRLYMKAQALDQKNVWRDIEYLPSSSCGNSYHELSLEPGAYWEFSMPAYKGMIQTKIRLELTVFKARKDKPALVLYSNEIKGGVNPGQFSFKAEYFPSGIMDPYND